MTRPEIIRAGESIRILTNTIDLQDHNAPSAQDHSRQPIQHSPLGAGPRAPHQAEALREVAAEAAEENVRSPRLSSEWTNGDVQHPQHYGDEDVTAEVAANLGRGDMEQLDDRDGNQNGGQSGHVGEDADMADGEGDDGMDDDMMDKISSSPSIDDGGCSLPQFWPQRSDSLSRESTSQSFSQACYESSPLFRETTDQFNLSPQFELHGKDVVPQHQIHNHNHNHHLGKYLDDIPKSESNHELDKLADALPLRTNGPDSQIEDYDLDYELDAQAEELLTGRVAVRDDNDNYGDESYVSEDETLITIPYESSEDEDDDYEISFPADSRFVDSGWGGECLQESEDIDFEFVYALHTFVATVEGQANATKGDTMVLLDDSNSYWWLVRVVKDSSIGYLPAEHIETPTERLARLNKHRNIDLTSTMLGDQAEKSKNPIKKAIRRRNAKTVTFTAPTYVEASDIDYSTDEDEIDEMNHGEVAHQEQDGDKQDQDPVQEEVVAVEPLKPHGSLREVVADQTDPDVNSTGVKSNSTDTARTSDELFEGKPESKSRNGTLRNTDSFFKDDSVETRKITLTPNLLRDDSSTSTRTSNDSKEFKQRPSLDKLEKDAVSEKNKERKDKKEKKDKEKKPGMLSGLFKRKEKKTKAIDEEIDELMAGKQSNEISRASPSPSKDSEEIVNIEEQHSTNASPDIQRNPSKLQKPLRSETSPARKPGQVREQKPVEIQQTPAPERAPPADSVQTPSMRLVEPESSHEPPIQQTRMSPELTRGPVLQHTPQKEQKTGGAISKILRSGSSSTSESKPVKAKKAKERVELDDFDSTTEESVEEEPVRAPSKQSQRPIPGSFPDSYITTPANERSDLITERLSESPVQVSPVTSAQSNPPPLMVDTSSQEEPASPVSSTSPELIDPEDAHEKKADSSTTSTTWSDSQLRTFFDDDADIKDLLVVVYDKSGVVPAGPDHPITGNLFREENAKLADITNRLDGMLGDWLARKMRAQASR